MRDSTPEHRPLAHLANQVPSKYGMNMRLLILMKVADASIDPDRLKRDDEKKLTEAQRIESIFNDSIAWADKQVTSTKLKLKSVLGDNLEVYALQLIKALMLNLQKQPEMAPDTLRTKLAMEQGQPVQRIHHFPKK